jgi:hypothetical protein
MLESSSSAQSGDSGGSTPPVPPVPPASGTKSGDSPRSGESGGSTPPELQETERNTPPPTKQYICVADHFDTAEGNAVRAKKLKRNDADTDSAAGKHMYTSTERKGHLLFLKIIVSRIPRAQKLFTLCVSFSF